MVLAGVEGYSSGLQVPDKEKTLEFEPEKPVYSSKAKMKMEGGQAPVFLKQVSNVEVWQGDVARLSVTVTGSPTPKVQWFFNSTKLTSSTDCKVVFAGNNHSLILPYAGAQDEGEYTCVASNVHGETTCSARLHVRQRIPGVPCFARKPDSMRCAPGFTAVFEYTVAGEPCPDVLWFKGSEQLFSDARRSVAHHPDGSGSLTVQECIEEDTGLYTCKAVSALGEAMCSAELLVLPEEPESITTFVGKSAKLQCTVLGTPVIDVAWQKDGTTISPSDHHRISKVENKHVLEISLLTASDRGVYTCKASNKFGADICQAELIIIDKPHFIKVLQSVQSAVNKKVRLECQVDEDRKVTVGWTKDGNKIPPGKDYKIYFEDKIASLEIPLAKLKDSGHYVCTASNEAGSSSSSASVTVRGKVVLCPLYFSLLGFPISSFAGFFGQKSHYELFSDLPSGLFTSCSFPLLSPSKTPLTEGVGKNFSFLKMSFLWICGFLGRVGRGEYLLLLKFCVYLIWHQTREFELSLKGS
uniref:Ig-like domain-containing protein n=1 Tax=Strigops habroptila TaxID=2489341 RepID=A0A672U6F7_STRHB